ncbi:MAG: F0F1 ATP synthase subunit A [Fimbriimonas sp.]
MNETIAMDELFAGSTQMLAFAEEAHKEGAKHSGHHTLNLVGLTFYTVVVVLILFFFLSMAKREFKKPIFKTFWAQYFEQAYLFIENMCVGTIGSHGRKYVPMILTFWLVIFVSNLVALFCPTSPTADLSFNLGLALCSIGYVQYEGIKANGFIGHFSHFAGPKLGGILAILISPIIFAIEIISELMKNVSLSLRIYGNIDGGHRAADAMNELASQQLIPVGAFMLPIKLLTCVVQAMIFCLLTCVYLSLVTHHDEEHDHEHTTAEAH